ncbi:MAG: aldo/keto reductase [Verrucomicrobiota bacterium]
MKLEIPKIVFGSSSLGNLYEVVPYERKLATIENCIRHQSPLTVIDSAGKYGAGLSLECIGRTLSDLNVAPDRVLISNKLGWKRVPLTGPEPTFEKGAWFGLENDAVQCMGYDGILECYEQGNELLGDYTAKLLSVHDPDEYLAAAPNAEEAESRYQEVLESYRALAELKAAGKAYGIGVGSKDWTIIKRLFDDQVPLDWVMFANTFTLYSHPADVIEFILQLHEAGVSIINSAIFNGGFLIGSEWYNYKPVTRESHAELFAWRDSFNALCDEHNVKPALACAEFGLSVPGIAALALNTTKPERVEKNVALVNEKAPAAFWAAMKDKQLLEADYPYL